MSEPELRSALAAAVADCLAGGDVAAIANRFADEQRIPEVTARQLILAGADVERERHQAPASIRAQATDLPRAVELRDFLSEPHPPRPWIVGGLLQGRDLAMVHSWRGVGKTHFAHGLAVAVASGGRFLRYDAHEPRGVLLVDGEMPRELLQERLAGAVAAAEREVVAPFRLLAADLQSTPLPSLSGARGQDAVEAQLDEVSLIVLDNIATLLPTASENESDAWQPAQRWLLDLRRRGYTVLLLHHENRTGGQRGTSGREDVLSQVVQLKRPSDYSPVQGCRFEVHLLKARGVLGAAAEPFEAQLGTGPGGLPIWTMRAIADARRERVLDLYQAGVTSQREIARELNLGLGTVNRTLKELRAAGGPSRAVVS